MTASRLDSDADLEREMADHLARAGITLPPGRMGEVVREYRLLKQQIAIVRAACPRHQEPATTFAAAPPRRRRRSSDLAFLTQHAHAAAQGGERAVEGGGVVGGRAWAAGPSRE